MGAEEDRNKQLAEQLLDALSRADAETIAKLYADDFQLWTAGKLPFSGTKDRATALEGIPQVLGMFPGGLRFEIVAMTAEGERVAIEAVSHGTHASGAPYSNQYHFLMRARGGRILEFKEYMDTEHAREVFFADS
jgi:ketosteroid isomerase-like protein